MLCFSFFTFRTMNFKPSAFPGALRLVREGYYLSFAYFHSINHWTFAFKYSTLCVSFTLSPFQKLWILTHTHIIHYRSTFTSNLVDNDYAIAKYDFDNPIYQAEVEGE